jgi:hypothetical protein
MRMVNMLQSNEIAIRDDTIVGIAIFYLETRLQHVLTNGITVGKITYIYYEYTY